MWHVIAVKTVLPSLKSARSYCSEPQPPRVLWSGRLELVHEQAVQHFRLEGRPHHDAVECSRGLPLFQNDDWTYYIVGDVSEEARVR